MKTTAEMIRVILQYNPELSAQITKTERYINGIAQNLTQGQFNALVSLGTCISSHALGRSRLLQTPQNITGKDFWIWAERTGDPARRFMEMRVFFGKAPEFYMLDHPLVQQWIKTVTQNAVRQREFSSPRPR